MQSITFVSEKYDEIAKLLKAAQEENKFLIAECKSLKSELLESVNEIKILKDSFNDVDQYLRRDCVEIRGLPLTNAQENTNNIVLQVAEKIGVELVPNDISICHRLPNKAPPGQIRNTRPDAIIVKFVRRDVKEKFYRARKNLKNLTAADFGYQETNRIFINENLSQRNKELFNSCLKFKKDKAYKFIWTFSGKIYLRKDENTPPVHIKNYNVLQRL